MTPGYEEPIADCQTAVAYISIFTLPLVANDTITWRLQRRHLSSTPSATTRASKLPQLQRSESFGFAAAVSRGFWGSRDSIYAAFLRCRASQKDVATKAQSINPWAARVSTVG